MRTRITSFLKRFPFLEVHPALVFTIVLTPIAYIGLYSYLAVDINHMHDSPEKQELLALVKESQELLQASHEKAEKDALEYTKITRPNLYC